MKEVSKFKQEHSLEKRKQQAAKIKEKHAQRIPVIVEKYGKCTLPDIDKKKYLVPGDLTVGQFVYVIRRRIKLESEKTLFIFINNVLPATGELMMTVYEKHKDEDGFLYVVYHAEKALGSETLCLDVV